MKPNRITAVLFLAIILLTSSLTSAQEFWMSSCGDALVDSRDGNTYTTVQIGSQCWMDENMAYLPLVSPSSDESYTSPIYYVYGYQGTDVPTAKATTEYQTYGVLYNWPAAMAGSASSTANPSGVQGVCPTGWHFPSDAEWTQLTTYLGGESVAGGKIKETGTTHWYSPNTGATNSSGFTALAGGYRRSTGEFGYYSYRALFWSSAQSNSNNAWYRNLDYDDDEVDRNDYLKVDGFSVRCVKD